MSQFKKPTEKNLSIAACENSSFITWVSLFICSMIFLIYLNSWILNDNFSYLANIINQENRAGKLDECAGKYIYIQDLPTKFNHNLVENCSSLNKWLNMCEYLTNSGFGPKLKNCTNWYATNQFSLEVIFHNRMKQYKCLTNISALASAVYVPFYAGLDVARYLWDNHDPMMKDKAAIGVMDYLKKKPEWKTMWGHDHFLVAGRVSWDFRRETDNILDWGNRLLNMDEVKNMTSLVIESSPWSKTDFAIPYPTYFHPSSDDEVKNWQEKIRGKQREYLFSFAGAPRPGVKDSIRNKIIDQCLGSKGKYCEFLRCDSRIKNCDKPMNVMILFQNSVFCLQPPGDSYTRRSAFDAILGGCIPVFFHPGSAYVQYLWHLPKNYTSYSVFIPMEDVKKDEIGIEKRLLEISNEEVIGMREEVIKLIPKVIYGDPNNGRFERFEDAFDIAVKGILNRIEKIRGGIFSSFENFSQEFSWKYNFFVGLENHEWDSYFSRG